MDKPEVVAENRSRPYTESGLNLLAKNAVIVSGEWCGCGSINLGEDHNSVAYRRDHPWNEMNQRRWSPVLQRMSWVRSRKLMCVFALLALSSTATAQMLHVTNFTMKNEITRNGIRTYAFGDQRISEAQFMRIGGYGADLLAEEFHTTNRRIVIRMFTFLGLGVGSMVISDGNAGLTAGAVLILSSIGGGVRRIARGNHYLTLLEAREIERNYNAQF
jgi:hypothetical protein